ncbi:hypothetical protein [Terribacillus aidingensis]|uniref:hypothetical protein n=1 Tax=Terribacillus aidingensis TaxID=586416 RepID=UPI00117F82D9|nr:hypothetical protein [Terribacillus aidingensis]
MIYVFYFQPTTYGVGGLVLIHNAARKEIEACVQPGSITVSAELVGDRPAGSQAEDAPIRQIALRAADFLRIEVTMEEPLSTDANVPSRTRRWRK